MRRRNRILTGILALTAMTFSVAETVVGSTCAPGMDMDMHEVGETHVHGGDGMADTADTSQDREHGEAGPGEGHCPFGPAVAGCAGVASFPSQVAGDIVPRLRADLAVFSESTEHPLLLANALFHPPRA